MLEKKYNAVYYERVSTTHEEQSNSLENQRKLCESYLNRHPNILLAEPIDTYSERISGKTDLRPKYEAMINRISHGDIDYLMVKDLKRLSRSTEVSAQLRNLSKNYGFKLILLSTGEIYDPNADEYRMLYGFESLVNEEVVYRQSEYGRIAHRQKMDAKRLTRQNATFGFRWNYEKKDMEIYEPEASLVRKLFDMYVFHSCGVLDISNFLYASGYPKSTVTIRKWLVETAYIGIFHMNKKGSDLGVGAGQKTRRYDNPTSEWVAVERPDLKIVEPEIFYMAQKILHARKNCYEADKNGVKQGRFTGCHLFTSKIFCAECGFSFLHVYTDRKKRVSVYQDSLNRKKKRLLGPCPNTAYNRLYEEDLKDICLTAINQTIQEGKECFELLIKALDDTLKAEKHHSKIISNLKSQITTSQKQANKIKSAFVYAEGDLRDDLMKDYEEMKGKIASLNQELEQAVQDSKNKDSVAIQMARIKEAISELEQVKELDRQIIDTFIKKILVSKDGTVQILMNTDAILTYHLPEPVKKRISKKESSFSVSNTSSIYSIQNYDYVVKKVIQDALCYSCSKAPEPLSP